MLDTDDRWYNGLNAVVTNLMLEVVRLFIEAEAAAAVSASNENDPAFSVH